jgi:hypothetical protein
MPWMPTDSCRVEIFKIYFRHLQIKIFHLGKSLRAEDTKGVIKIRKSKKDWKKKNKRTSIDVQNITHMHMYI